MKLLDIYTIFESCKNWEERYRLLIQFSRKLPKFSESELDAIPEIASCESRLWFSFQAEPREVKAYSDARLMQGILMILVTVLSEKSIKEIQQLNLKQIFDELKITQHLTSTRLNALKQIENAIKCGC